MTLSEPVFTLEMAGTTACGSGLDQAKDTLEKGKQYSGNGLLKAGLSIRNVEWIILQRALIDPTILIILRKWAASCGKPVDNNASIDDCLTGVKYGYAEVWRQALKNGKSMSEATDIAMAFKDNALKKALK